MRPRPSSVRAVAFSDAIFAITITLLVLEIERPSFTKPGLADRLLDNWPQYAAFLVSFVYIGVLWLNHHALFARVARVDVGLNAINLAILGTTALLPFSTAVLAGAYGVDAPTENRTAAVVLYALVSLAMAAAWVPVFGYLSRHRELLADPDDAEMLGAQRSRPIVGVISYGLAGLLGWLVSTYAAMAMFAWMILYHAVTSEGLHARGIVRWFSPPRARAAAQPGADADAEPAPSHTA